jgi:hypothetical protein
MKLYVHELGFWFRTRALRLAKHTEKKYVGLGMPVFTGPPRPIGICSFTKLPLSGSSSLCWLKVCALEIMLCFYCMGCESRGSFEGDILRPCLEHGRYVQ